MAKPNNIVISSKGPSRLGMDTHNQREGLHMWIGHNETHTNDKTGNKEVVFVGESLHMSRTEAKALVDEINRRLF